MSPSFNMIGSVCKSKPPSFTLCYWREQNYLESSEKIKKRDKSSVDYSICHETIQDSIFLILSWSALQNFQWTQYSENISVHFVQMLEC